MRSAKVAKRKGPDGKMLSAGFGFVECSSEAAAKGAVKMLQGSTLDGHKLVLQLSLNKGAGGAAAGGTGDAGAGAAAGGKRKAGQPHLPDTAKMVVRNVAFEATRKDIMGLFTPFGQIKSARLPRKFDGTHRWGGRSWWGWGGVGFAWKCCIVRRQPSQVSHLSACPPFARGSPVNSCPPTFLFLHSSLSFLAAGALRLWTLPPSRRPAMPWRRCRARTCTAAALCWSGQRREAWMSCGPRQVTGRAVWEREEGWGSSWRWHGGVWGGGHRVDGCAAAGAADDVARLA